MPTFGDTTAGTDTFPCDGDRAIVGKFTLSEAGDVQSITVFFAAGFSAGTSFKGLIYDDDGAGGLPGTRLAVGAAVAVPGTTGGELTSTLSSPVSLAAGDYWLGAVVDSFTARWNCDTGVGGQRQEALTYNSPAASFGTPAAGTANRVSAYATYTTGGVGPLLGGKLARSGRLRGFLKRA